MDSNTVEEQVVVAEVEKETPVIVEKKPKKAKKIEPIAEPIGGNGAELYEARTALSVEEDVQAIDEITVDPVQEEIVEEEDPVKGAARLRRAGKSSASFDITKWRRRGRR